MSKTEIFNSYEEFLNRPDKSINGISINFALKYPNYEKDNETNNNCYNCLNCNNCINCDYCINCSYCTNSSLCDEYHHCTNCYCNN